MGSGFIDTGDEESYTIRSFTIVLGIGLGAVTDGGNESFDGDCTVVGHAGREGLVFHEVRENAGIGCETCEGETNVLIYGDYFFLVGGEFFCVPLFGELVSLCLWSNMEVKVKINIDCCAELCHAGLSMSGSVEEKYICNNQPSKLREQHESC